MGTSSQHTRKSEPEAASSTSKLVELDFQRARHNFTSGDVVELGLNEVPLIRVVPVAMLESRNGHAVDLAEVDIGAEHLYNAGERGRLLEDIAGMPRTVAEVRELLLPGRRQGLALLIGRGDGGRVVAEFVALVVGGVGGGRVNRLGSRALHTRRSSL